MEEVVKVKPTSSGRTILSKRVSTNKIRSNSPFTSLVSRIWPFVYADFAARWVPLEGGYFAQYGIAESADFVVDNTK